MTESRLELALNKNWHTFQLDMQLSVPLSGITAFYGPSGSGKTSLLRCVAGLEQAAGTLCVGDQVWQDTHTFLPAHLRAVGMVFQDSRLFPHLNVMDNLQFGFRKLPHAERVLTPEHAIDLMDLAPLLKRRPHNLSGGEKQRVAIGRALANNPSLLLLDEPLASLDPANKQRILPYLKKLHHELDIPMLYVSHSLQEISQLADYLVLIEQGAVQTNGPLQAMLANAALHCGEQEAGAVLMGTITQIDPQWQLAAMSIADDCIWFTHHATQEGSAQRLRELAKDISISRSKNTEQSIQNLLPARIESITQAPHPARQLVRLALKDEQILLAELTARAVHHLQLRPDEAVWAQIKSVAVIE